jgi:hypothetical protein
MLLVVGSTTIAAMLFMTMLTLAVVCRCGRKRLHEARLVAVAVPVIEVTGVLQETAVEATTLGAPADPDERAPILEYDANAANWRRHRGSTVAADSVGGAGVADAMVVIGRCACGTRPP